MKIFQIIVLVILIFLAVSSGATKVALMEQDVAFFGKYGFTNTLLMLFGAVQLIGGGMMVFFKTRVIGAGLVAVTFAISLVVLAMEGSIPAAIATLIALVLLGVTIHWTRARA